MNHFFAGQGSWSIFAITTTSLIAPWLVEGERVNLEMLREATPTRKPAERLATRVAQLREMLIWADGLTPPEDAQTKRAWERFLAQRDLAHKILEEQGPVVAVRV